MNKNYIPLYRKYRPQTIEQIVGQEHIKKALANAIKMDRISHAYLFTGSRGTGKTSTARIFAKSLNCVEGPTISPCNKCENCLNITNSVPIDVIEIDAASNRSVNDAEEIIQSVAIAPVHSRYKIYIIDEVHMLSTTAFNALLKTLEEPPKNVIFILATTEIHKVLDTIKSRCQRFDFKRISIEDITKHLRYISDNEEINITDSALEYIAQNSAGGMRDSIALLDQLSVLNSEQTPIDVDDINRLLGRLSFDLMTKLFEMISLSKPDDALDILNDIYNQGNEPIQILSNLLEYLRNALILKAAKSGQILQLNEVQSKLLSEKLKNIELHQIVSLIDKCANYIKELKTTSNPKLWLDISVIDMANLVENTKLEDLQRRISLLESGQSSGLVNVSSYNTPPSPVVKPIPKPQISSVPKAKTEQKVTENEVLNEPVPNSKPAADSGLKSLWANLLENISSFPSRAILKQQAIPVKITQEEVIISIKNPSWLKQFGVDGSKYSFIVNAANALFSSEVKKIIVRAPEKGDDAIRKTQNASSDEDEKPAPAPKNFIPETPEIPKEEVDQVIAQENSKTYKPSKVGDLLHNDQVNMVMDLFEGKLIE